MVNEPKRIDVNQSVLAVSQSHDARFGPGSGTILRRLTNYHNIWFGFTAEPENADANANGKWILWLKPDVTQSDVTFSSVYPSFPVI